MPNKRSYHHVDGLLTHQQQKRFERDQRFKKSSRTLPPGRVPTKSETGPKVLRRQTLRWADVGNESGVDDEADPIWSADPWIYRKGFGPSHDTKAQIWSGLFFFHVLRRLRAVTRPLFVVHETQMPKL